MNKVGLETRLFVIALVSVIGYAMYSSFMAESMESNVAIPTTILLITMVTGSLVIIGYVMDTIWLIGAWIIGVKDNE